MLARQSRPGHRFTNRPPTTLPRSCTRSGTPPSRGPGATLDAALANGGLDQPVHLVWPGRGQANLRRLVCDMIEEYGRHTGHADLLREAVDGGAPFGERAAVADDGTSPAPGELNGYTIVEADSLATARSLLDGHPFLSEGKGRFTIEVFELVPMAM